MQVHFHPLLQWVLGIAASLTAAAVVWLVASVTDHENRLVAIEASRFTRVDAESFVRSREYDAHISAVTTQLARIEDKIDALQGGR